MDILPRAVYAGCLWVLLTSSAFAADLSPYLLRAADRTSECQPAKGFHPIDPKITLFYEYRAYQMLMPSATDRHAQSFRCGAQIGTVYYFLYQDADQAEAAQRVAHSIFRALKWVPPIESIPNGFVVVSFVHPP